MVLPSFPYRPSPKSWETPPQISRGPWAPKRAQGALKGPKGTPSFQFLCCRHCARTGFFLHVAPSEQKKGPPKGGVDTDVGVKVDILDVYYVHNNDTIRLCSRHPNHNPSIRSMQQTSDPCYRPPTCVTDIRPTLQTSDPRPPASQTSDLCHRHPTQSIPPISIQTRPLVQIPDVNPDI